MRLLRNGQTRRKCKKDWMIRGRHPDRIAEVLERSLGGHLAGNGWVTATMLYSNDSSYYNLFGR